MFNPNSQVNRPTASHMDCYITISLNFISIASVGNLCKQSEFPPPRSQLQAYVQGYVTIAETAEDRRTADCSRRNGITVEPLIYDPPHERPPAIYDHISRNGW